MQNHRNIVPDFGDSDQRWEWVDESMFAKYRQAGTNNRQFIQDDLVFKGQLYQIFCLGINV